MGEVRDAIEGRDDNVVQRLTELQDVVSDLATIKQHDAMSEDHEAADNIRKAALLRATHSLLTAARALMEDY